ncbi:hypothetical protein DEU56DRAFT_905952 [Suillus clintonianus]|uniref:uncharacterized protein n=1 Tax=Suillus clintonianus TaxID=1904413 RepID=UPI001B8664E8|nr:uncharacterized protein DEU56DRAFT_905952 [Suillus clintonianus]KAG2157300.1 hypothetical protein DEU56DRAFT_905952 [Suillus clintonianus]
MPSIIAPSPRRVAHACFQDALQSPSPLPDTRHCHVPHASPTGVISEILPSRMILSPPRLLSPITLNESRVLSLKSKSPMPCGAAVRRGLTRSTRSTKKRRRFPPRIESPLDVYGRVPMFDRLPWISAMEFPPRFDLYDTADLSLLPGVEELPFSDTIPASGPVRHRKSSLRSNPLGNNPESESPSRQNLPFQSPSCDRECLKTPPPRVSFDPTRVTFHNLMPVFPHGVANPSPQAMR